MVYAKTKIFGFDISFSGIEIPIEILEKAVIKENPAIYFNDLECYYWIFDFSFEWNGEKYWIEMVSKNDPWVHGMKLNVYK